MDSCRIDVFGEFDCYVTTEPLHGNDGDQDDQIIPTDVQEADRSRQTDRAMYRIDPRAAGKELRLELRPDDRTYRTRACLPWPTHQATTNGRARTHFDRVKTETDHSLSLFAQILQLSKDLGRAGTKLAHEPYPTRLSG
ncbi:hypothetical protein F2Q69_00013111 [Brassica cretica]|uniref:Uncharacterized protein n=1 Tax=Brassica cretica TaxID=69181 RepID=A0A8S9R107_BRACR|nr:hypothetical protein F2Q69_00013111 [Brassica cretica]